MSDAIGLVGIAMSIVGIPLAYFLARRGRQRPDLRYALDFTVLLSPDDGLAAQGLFLSFSGHPIRTVSRSYIAFWNHRGDTVRGSDIVPADPLCISIPEGEKILQARVLFRSRAQISFDLRINDDHSAVLIEFDFLDAGDGAVVELVHEGIEEPLIVGTTRGATISYQSQASLEPDFLQSIAKGKPRRLWARIRKNYQNGFLLAASMFILFAGFLLSNPFRPNPRLVNVKDYDLSKLEGQAKFANEVQRIGEAILPAVLRFVILGLSLCTLVILCLVAMRFRLKFPTSILREQVVAADQTSTTSPPTTDPAIPSAAGPAPGEQTAARAATSTEA
jgi:hypothetical protein